MIKIYKEQENKSYLKHTLGEFYVEHSLNYLKIKSLKDEKDFWIKNKNLITPSPAVLKRSSNTTSSVKVLPVFKKTVRGAQVNRPSRKKK
jgi:hypothetical protein